LILTDILDQYYDAVILYSKKTKPFHQ